jgi:hypothetical protein
VGKRKGSIQTPEKAVSPEIILENFLSLIATDTLSLSQWDALFSNSGWTSFVTDLWKIPTSGKEEEISADAGALALAFLPGIAFMT